MSKVNQASLSQQRGKAARAGWDLAIDRAEGHIRAAEARIEKLKRSIEVFKECRKRGDPWPEVSDPKVENLTQKVTLETDF